MRTSIFIFLLMASLTVSAQSGDSSYRVAALQSSRWSLAPFASISTGYNFFNGGGALIFAAPVGLQLNYRLTNNWYAFTGVSVAPAYTSFSRTNFLSAKTAPFYPPGSFGTSQFGVYSGAHLGLMYVNDAHTFSISGSVGVERSSNPYLAPFPAAGARTGSAVTPNR